MMKRIFCILLVVIMIFLALPAQSFAGLVDWEARNRYLKAQEEAAKTTSQDPKMSKDLPHWMQVEPTVKTDEEKKFDVNKDGVFQPAETKVYLRTVSQEVQDGSGLNVAGRNVQNSEVLKEYDANKDGIVSKLESEKMKKDSL